MDHAGWVEAQAGEVDDVEIGLQPGLHQAAIVEAIERGGVGGLFLDDIFQREAFARRAVAHPMGQHEGGDAAIADGRDMGPAIGGTGDRIRVGQHVVDGPQIAVGEAHERVLDEALAAILQHDVQHHLARVARLDGGDGGDAFRSGVGS